MAVSGSIALAGGIAQAATLSSAGSDGLINRGNGFKKFQNGDVGTQGEMVLSKTSDVTVTYENGCIVVVKIGVVYAIETPNACLAASSPTVTPTGLLVGGAVVGGIAAAAIIVINNNSTSP